MGYKYFYLMEKAPILGIELEPRKCYKLTDVNYDEVMALCKKSKAVALYRKVKLAKDTVRAYTVKQKREEEKKAEKKAEKKEKKKEEGFEL